MRAWRRNAKWSWLVGALLFLFGLPGALDDGAVWWGWLGGIDAPVPYIVAAVGLAVMVLSGVVALRVPPAQNVITAPNGTSAALEGQRGKQAATNWPSGSGKVTPELVMRLFEGRTALQASMLLRSYVGRPMTLSGAVYTVSSPHGLLSATFIEPFEAFMFFSEDHRAQLVALAKGDKIAVRGKLYDATSDSVTLHDCRLVSVEAR